MADVQLPYFDFLLGELAKNNAALEKSFGRHVHWGYWERPQEATGGDEDYGRAAEALTRELIGSAGIANGQTVLDVGCGFGGTVATINESFNDCRLTGLNIDARQLERARKLVLPLNGNTVDFVEGDACALPFADATFDRVLAVECIFHFPSREAFFREVMRVLKPGGVLALSDFVPSTLFKPFSSLGSTRMFRKFNAFGNCRIDTTVAAYRRLAADAGFTVKEERDITRNTIPTWTYVQKLVGRNVKVTYIEMVFSAGLAINRLICRSGLLTYRLLAFGKP